MNFTNGDYTYIYDIEDAGEDSENEVFDLTLVDSEVDDVIDGDEIDIAMSLEKELVSVPEILSSTAISQVDTPRRRGRPRNVCPQAIPSVNSSQIRGI